MAKAEYLHCVERARERYNVKLSGAVYDELCLMAPSGRVIRQEQRQRIVQVWSALRDKTFYVTWDEERECVTTLLPPEQFKGK